jgi:hypothetical protein
VTVQAATAAAAAAEPIDYRIRAKQQRTCELRNLVKLGFPPEMQLAKQSNPSQRQLQLAVFQ